MRRISAGLAVAAGLALAGCDSPKVTGSTAPLTDEEKAKIAAETKAIEDEESPNNKTRADKKKR